MNSEKIRRFLARPKHYQLFTGLRLIQNKISSFEGFHRALHYKTVLNIAKTIQKEKGVLSESIKKQCDDYAVDVLGNIEYAPWLYVFATLHGEFKEGWIPETYYTDHIRKLDGAFEVQGDLKAVSNLVLRTNKLPDLLYVQNQLFIEPTSYKVISDEDAFKILFEENDRVIFKSNSSMRGVGVRIYKKDQLKINEIKGKSGVFQKVIDQHSFFDNLFPHPGATIRVTTALDSNGHPTVRGAYLRLGRSNKDTSSQLVQSSTAIKVAIDLETAALYSVGYLSDWSSTTIHPDTGISFSGQTVPNFKDICMTVEQLHANYPFVRCIGWDVTVNKDNEVEIMEWNTGNNSITFHEAMHGPCFKDFLE